MDVPEKPLPSPLTQSCDMNSLASALDLQNADVLYVGTSTSYFGFVEIESTKRLQDLNIDSAPLAG